MHLPRHLLGGLLLASCTPVPAPVPATTVVPPAAPSPALASPPRPAPQAPNPAPALPAPPPRLVHARLAGADITAITFDSRTHRLVVADQPAGPGSRWPDARSAAASRSGLAAVNGGFFTPEGKPLGLVIAAGTRSGSINRTSSLGAGFYLDDGSHRLIRREQSGSGSELLQSGPFLIENGRAVAGLSPESSSARTFVGWDGGTGWFIGRSGSGSLAGLAKALEGQSIGGIPVRHVLNLDGGRSSDLWAGPAVGGGPVTQRPFWNKPVRNFLVVVAR